MSRAERQAWVERGCRDPLLAYHEHACNALRRGVDFELTFDEWWAIWQPRYHQRGRGLDKAVMCRAGDEGGYASGNVRIDTGAANLAEAKAVSQARNRAEADTEWVRNPFRGSAGYFKQREMEESKASYDDVG